MQIVKAYSYQELSKKASEIVIKAIAKKPDLVLGLATGSTPLGLYQLLVEANKNGEADFSKVKTFNLDEYAGLKKDNTQSYHYFMQENLFSKINIEKENIHILGDEGKSPEEECKIYEDKIKEAGGIDLQILGIGSNGHIAFNEPGSSKDSRTRIIKLDEKTRQDNARFFRSIDEVPTHAFTMGIGTILEAREIILLAGKSKKEIIQKVISSQPIPEIPASFLKLHSNCAFIIEE